MHTLYVIGAYGRNYDTLDAALADWEAGKDFKIAEDGPYLSKRDADQLKRDGYNKIGFFKLGPAEFLGELYL